MRSASTHSATTSSASAALVAHGRPPRPAGDVRPPQRARRLRRRLCGHPHRRGQPRAGRAGAHRPDEPGAPRCHRLRARLGRRCRHPAPGPGRVPPRGRRLRASRGRRVRRRHRLPAVRCPGSGRCRLAHRDDRGRRRPGRPRLAGGPGRPAAARQRRPRHHARLLPALRRRRREHRSGAGPQGLRAAQARRARGRGLLPLAVRPDHRLQGHADHRPAGALLPGPVRPPLRHRHRAGPLAVLHQHLPELAARPPVPLRRAQRRDQHGQGQPQLDAGPRVPARLEALRCGQRRAPGADVPGLHRRTPPTPPPSTRSWSCSTSAAVRCRTPC